jgi:threonine dehydrogenase-like Zn-dependent dehydrogenase
MRAVPSNVPTHFCAAVLRKFNSPLVIETVPVPREMEPGALLVKTECCTLCGTDVHLVRGNLNRRVDLPVIAGHEMAGRVVAKGDGADRDSVGQPLRLGDRIVWTRTNCGQCYTCTVAKQPTLCPDARAYMYETMSRPPHLLGGMSEYVYVFPESGRVVVPEAIDCRLASMASCAFRSVVHAFEELGAIKPTDSVVVQGTGPLGLLAIGLARIHGAQKIIAIGAPVERLSLAADFGADCTLSIETHSAEDRRELVLEQTAGRGADIVMDFAGQSNAFCEGLALIRRGGTYLIVGQMGLEEIRLRPSEFVHRNLRLIGSLAGGAKDYWASLQLIETHQSTLPFHKLVSKSYSLEHADEAIYAMEHRTEIKPVIFLDEHGR